MGTFKDANQIWLVVNNMVQAEQPRARNRTLINEVFNGNPPYSETEAKENSVDTNVNFLEGTRIIHHARGSFYNAFCKTQNYFTVHVDWGQRDKRTEFGHIITREMNRVMKRSSKYITTLQSQFASVVLHGVGPVRWLYEDEWCPKASGIEDVLVPSRTLQSLENLDHFAVRTSFTAAELVKMTKGKDRVKGWNKKLIASILNDLDQKLNTGQSNRMFQDYLNPEKVEEDYKENSGYWGSDMIPAVNCFDFYFRNKETGQWHRRIIIDRQTSANEIIDAAGQNDFLFDPGDRSYGEDISQIMHVHFADGAVVPPFRWHSVRSLGYLLYAICHLKNRVTSKFFDAVMESMLWYFRNVTEGDKERLQRVDLHHLGIIPEGLSWVPQNERHQVDFNLVNGALAGLKQMMAENSANYISDPDDGTSKELTATEVMAKVNSSNALLGSMLNNAYESQKFQYREIARRFATMDSDDCKKFRDRCVSEGVPAEVFNHFDTWEVTCERVMGNGNKMLEIAQAEKLMSVRPLMNGNAQNQVLHMFVEANSDDALLADRLVPMNPKTNTPTVEKATMAWGTLYDGLPVVVTDGISETEYVECMLQLLDAKVHQLEQLGTQPDAKELMGLQNVLKHIEQHVQKVSEDPQAKQKVKVYMDKVGQVQNQVKAWQQQLQQAMQAQAEAAQQQQNAEAQAKVQAIQMQAQANLQVKQATTQQELQHREARFQQEQQIRAAETQNRLQAQAAQTHAGVGATVAQTNATIVTGAAKTRADIENSHAKTEADIQNKRKLTAAAAESKRKAEKSKPTTDK